MSEIPKPPAIDLSKCSEQERALAEQFVRMLRRLDRSTSKEMTLALNRHEQSMWLTVPRAGRPSSQAGACDSAVRPDSLGSSTTHTYDGTGRLVCSSYLGGTITTITYDYPTAPRSDKDQRGEDDSLPGPDTIIEPPPPGPDEPPG
jgi:hypothetical protein